MQLKKCPEDFVVKEIYDFIPDDGPYTYFILKKKNYTTERAIEAVSRHCNVSRKFFNYSGIKDKHAVTEQYCSVKGRIRSFSLPEIDVKVIGTSDKPISLGDHQGNIFDILVRDVKHPPEKIDWIVNYFDEQRFSKNNAAIGKAVTKGDFASAVDMIDDARVVSSLAKNPSDKVGAFRNLPKKIQSIYVAAYQSFLWNTLACNLVSKTIDDSINIKYSLGHLIFPIEKVQQRQIPLISFDCEFDLYDSILVWEKLTKRDFIIKQIPYLTPQGAMRDMVVEVIELKIKRSKNDYQVSFSLPKGSYATMAIKRMFWKEL